MKGAPPASWTSAVADRFSGTCGLSSIPDRNDEVSAEISTAPAKAVPIEAPMLVKVFWIPPTSGLRSSGTEETVTAPSWEASAPMPSPASRSGRSRSLPRPPPPAHP